MAQLGYSPRMKALLTILVLLTAAICGCASPLSAIRGVWVVTEVRFGGDSAMSDEDAKKWIGRTMSIGDVSSSLDGERLSGCRVTEKESEAQTFFEDSFRIRPGLEVGFHRHQSA